MYYLLSTDVLSTRRITKRSLFVIMMMMSCFNSAYMTFSITPLMFFAQGCCCCSCWAAGGPTKNAKPAKCGNTKTTDQIAETEKRRKNAT